MKYIIILVLIILMQMTSALGVEVTLQFNRPKLHQGAIEDAKFVLNTSAAQKISLQSYKGKTLAETLYLFDVSPLVRREGTNQFEADAKVIFAKIPKGHEIVVKDLSPELAINWNSELEIIPTEGKKFTYGVFFVPEKMKFFLWLITGICLIFLIWGGRVFYRKREAKKVAMQQKKALKEELLAGKSYEEIVHIWQKRNSFLTAFPQILEHFKHFELTLFKYQFKPSLNDIEKQKVIEAYQEFLRQIAGGFDGI